MPHPTNQQLAEQIQKIDDKVDRKHSSMVAAFAKFRTEIREALEPFHDYLVGQDAIDKASKKSSGNVPPELWWLIKALVLIIAATVGAKVAL